MGGARPGRAISQQWVGDKGLPEMGFTLGGVDEALDPAVKVGLAVDADGQRARGDVVAAGVRGRAAQVRGWTLDVMRRRTAASGRSSEFLIASACLAFQAGGAEFVSLSGAPLAAGGRRPARSRPSTGCWTCSAPRWSRFYGFRSLHAFKAKFSAPVRAACTWPSATRRTCPASAIALTRAYLPDATPRQLLAAGLSAHGEQAGAGAR